MPAKVDLKGKVYGRLTVIKESNERAKNGHIVWICECKCGKETKAPSGHLKSGHTRSCGCLHKERTVKHSTTHGLRQHPLYNVHSSMKNRCTNPKSKAYRNYGGRGIKVCDRWLESFENFYEDIIEGYIKGLQLDRIDNDGDYSKENCRWVTPQQNSMNRGVNRKGSSIYKGVILDKISRKWVSKFKQNGKVHYIGTFTLETEAALAYNKKALELNGEYAYLNKV